MIQFPFSPVWFQVEYDGHPVYSCSDIRDALDSAQFLASDSAFVSHFAVSEISIGCYIVHTRLCVWVWDISSEHFDFGSAKVFKFFDLEADSDGGPEES